MKKITLIMITLIISMSLANADETTSSTETGTVLETPNTEVDDSGNDSDDDLSDDSDDDSDDDSSDDSSDDSDKKGELRDMRGELKWTIETNREEIRENREDFRTERGTGVVKKVALSEETKAKIKELMEAHKAKVEEYKVALEAKELTRAEFLAKVEELRKSTHESLVALVWNNEEAMRILGLKKEMLENNMDLRKENVQAKKEFVNFKQGLKAKYKERFIKSLWTKLDKLSNEKLEKVLARIDAAVEKTWANEKLSQINKDKILAQLEALKAIINEKLWVTEEDEELEINVDELIGE